MTSQKWWIQMKTIWLHTQKKTSPAVGNHNVKKHFRKAMPHTFFFSLIVFWWYILIWPPSGIHSAVPHEMRNVEITVIFSDLASFLTSIRFELNQEIFKCKLCSLRLRWRSAELQHDFTVCVAAVDGSRAPAIGASARGRDTQWPSWVSKQREKKRSLLWWLCKIFKKCTSL